MKTPTPESEYFDILLSVCLAKETSLFERYRRMRNLLEHLCRIHTQDKSLQMTDLSARISYISTLIGLDIREQNRLHTFRLTSNAILNRKEEPVADKLLRDAKTLAFFVKRLFGQDIPPELYRLFPQADATYIVSSPSRERIRRMRVCFQYADETYLYVSPVDVVSDVYLRVRYNVSQANDEFNATCQLLWKHAQVNLLDVSTDEAGVLTPFFIVLEPDYLLDISSLAECFREYGHHPANYALSKLQPIDNPCPLLLGNIANLFLDDRIYAEEQPDYKTSMQKAFRRYPIELTACAELRDREKEVKFFEDCKLHFKNINQTVAETFPMPGYELDKTDAVVEPSYICEALGLQGRLDYMQRDMTSFIEMKSGKADEYAILGKVEPKENNRVQMLLYQAVLEYSMGRDHREVKAYLFYTRYPLLYPARPSWAMLRRVIDVRNRIVANEYGIQLRNSAEYTAQKLSEINANTLNERGLTNRLWTQYLYPTIETFAERLRSLSPLEQSYYYSLYNFITKEQYTSKSGDTSYEGRKGTASLWLSTLAEKCEAGEILYDLIVKENRAGNEHKAYIVFSRNDHSLSEKMPEALPNFRPGDAIILYERNTNTDNVTNKPIFKGNIETVTEDEINIRLRAAQQNPAVLPSNSLYAVEHDSSDVTFRTMFLGLSAFSTANQDRRDLLLGQRPPQFDTTLDARIADAKDDFSRVTLKAQAAKDYFLLAGPPGTGKTSRALKQMAETFHEEGKQLLLLAYTNRATDEICRALSSIIPCPDFIRIGSELPCDPLYRDHLIENVLADCNGRKEANDRIHRCRIFTGTVASVSAKPELFRLKHFDVAIVDEATQILEPQLLGILCARNEDKENAVGKFILIGDHKQLPAVVLQSPAQSEVHDEGLRAVGLINLRDSLFERLYRSQSGTRKERNEQSDAENERTNRVVDQLRKQGRMHPAVASFANIAFYGGKLEPVGLPHQCEELVLSPKLVGDEDSTFLAKRIAFLPSGRESDTVSGKVNRTEAITAARLAKKVFIQYESEFKIDRTLGIITPYRSQIALIKRETARLNIPQLNDILVDTVERFQGSERDVIIYSFCLNHPWQLEFLSASNLMEEDGMPIDRKLNVVLTRARKQMFITGVPELLRLNSVYAKLLEAFGYESLHF